jgi:hypothetical protein
MRQMVHESLEFLENRFLQSDLTYCTCKFEVVVGFLSEHQEL